LKFRFSLIVCTYKRPGSLERLLKALQNQTVYPDEVLIIDGSRDVETEQMLEKNHYPNLIYYRVKDKDKGLTLQRNYGLRKVSDDFDIVCFLDDDIVPEINYFEELLKTYIKIPNAIATGGWIIDETEWNNVAPDYLPKFDEYLIDGYVRKLGQRNVLRKRLGLLSPLAPGCMPEFSHGFSTGFLPPTGKIYPVEFFMGGVSSYRRSVFRKIKFSDRFIGYGLYEDMDFCLRLLSLGKLYLNTSARVAHLHEEAGRPNYYKYGRMVIENGFYVWRLKYRDPKLSAKIKWALINILLLLIRALNGVNDRDAMNDAKGRFSALIGLAIKRWQV
jgi:GT2 family glycosyltransferase